MESRSNPETAIEPVGPRPLPTVARGPRLGLPTKAELDSLLAYGQVMLKSGMVPAHIKTAEAALVVMRYGHQLGIDEFTALQNMWVIGGKPAAFANLLHSLILRDHGGGAIVVKKFTADDVVIECRRKDSGHTATIGYTIAEAKQAGVYESNPQWKKYPADMLFARCISRAGRQLYRDSTMGMYVPEELGANVIEVDGEVIETSSPRATETDPPAASNDDARLERAMKRLHALGKERELTHEQLHDLAVARYDVPSLGDCTFDQLSTLGLAIKECTANEALDLVAVAKALGEADDRDFLNSISGEVARAALPDGAKELLIETIRRVGDRIAA